MYMCTMGHYSAIKRNEITPPAAKIIDFAIILKKLLC